MGIMPITPELRHAVEANLFPAARPAVEPWEQFRWHGAVDGTVTDTYKEHSSQALAIDVFGTLQLSPDRDRILDQLAGNLNLPVGGPWHVQLEWYDADNYLRERQPTWVDAVARSPHTIIFFECKFTEADGGHCSQILPLRSGPRRGLIQCNGHYAPQANPANGVTASCALTGKGLRYWEVIPAVFAYANQVEHHPCPFAGPWFQWMRNLTVCYEVARQQGLRPACVVVYADGPGLPLAQHVHTPEWQTFVRLVRPTAIRLETLSYQAFLQLAITTAPTAPVWPELAAWVEGKIRNVCDQRAKREH